MNRTLLAIKAIRQLGIKPIGLLALYRLGLASGYYKWSEKGADEDNRIALNAFRIEKIFDLPTREALLACLSKQDVERLRSEADEIVSGKVRLFGGDPVDLKLKSVVPLSHWTSYETDKTAISGDIKMTWEPARFSWAYTLARAFYLCKETKYAVTFWRLTVSFLEANPPYKGPQWMSGQEAALRLIGLTFAAQVFAASEITVPKQIAALGKVIAVHARRIPPTLVYARAQNNNHLLSEAAGLITAALVLPRHPQARRWLELGWTWFNRGLEEQINGEGVYIQHSANYQRLMLQLALWVNLISQYPPKGEKSGHGKGQGMGITNANFKRLNEAASWLLAIMDEQTGRCPNLGANDGATIQPLSICPFEDYRPVLQAGSNAFKGKPAFGKGAWDEMSLWYGVMAQPEEGQDTIEAINRNKSPHILCNPVSDSRGCLRIANFEGRPGHADQLHFDLWRQGINIAQDAGTFSYNDPSPWDNVLVKTDVHNTITVNGMDQMTRAGKFLWLDWAQARLLKVEQLEGGSISFISAEHDGYRKIGIIHRRSVSTQPDGSWLIEDQLNPSEFAKDQEASYLFRLHWLLSNAPWEWELGTLTLFTKKGICTVEINSEKPITQYQLVRGGQLLAGEGDISLTRGWVSPTYGQKEPALSLSAVVMAKPPLLISTQFRFHNY